MPLKGYSLIVSTELVFLCDSCGLFLINGRKLLQAFFTRIENVRVTAIAKGGQVMRIMFRHFDQT